VNRDKLFSGNGERIVQAAYRVIDALQYEPKHRQVQAVAVVMAAMVETLGIRLSELIEGVMRVLRDKADYSTTRALFGYIKAKIGGLA
jgi:hypothetical protein